MQVWSMCLVWKKIAWCGRTKKGVQGNKTKAQRKEIEGEKKDKREWKWRKVKKKIKRKEKLLTLWSKLQTAKSKQHKTLENITHTMPNLCEQKWKKRKRKN